MLLVGETIADGRDPFDARTLGRLILSGFTLDSYDLSGAKPALSQPIFTGFSISVCIFSGTFHPTNASDLL
jgi:hypothetical protein